MKPATQLLVAIVVGFVIGGLMCRPDRAGEAAQRRADSLAVVVDTLEARDSARAITDAAADDTLAALRARNRQLGRAVVSATGFGDSLSRALRIWADSMVPKRLVVAFIDSTQATIRLQAAQIAGLERASVIADRRRVSADSAADAWHRVALRFEGELAAALKRANGRWACVGGVGGVGGPAVAGNASQTTVGLGAAAGFGAMCGRTFSFPRLLPF